MTVEFIGMIHHREASETIRTAAGDHRRGYIRDSLGRPRPAVSTRSWSLFLRRSGRFLVAAAAAAHTEKLGFLVAHRPGFRRPTCGAEIRQLDQITAAGRRSTSSAPATTRPVRDGDTLTKADRYAAPTNMIDPAADWTEPGPDRRS